MFVYELNFYREMKVDISYIYEREVGLGLDVGFDKVTMV